MAPSERSTLGLDFSVSRYCLRGVSAPGMLLTCPFLQLLASQQGWARRLSLFVPWPLILRPSELITEGAWFGVPSRSVSSGF